MITLDLQLAERVTELERLIEELAKQALQRSVVDARPWDRLEDRVRVSRGEFTDELRVQLRDHTHELERILGGGR